MVSGPQPKRAPAAGSVVGQPATSRHSHIEAIVHSGGQIMIGTMKPIKGAAVAHDGKKTLVMLRCKPRESLTDILGRLDAAIATSHSTGQCVDEINKPDADHTYKY